MTKTANKPKSTQKSPVVSWQPINGAPGKKRAGWFRRLLDRWPKVSARVGKPKKAGTRSAPKRWPRINLGGIAAMVALTGVVAAAANLLTPGPAGELFGAEATPTFDPACRLREWTGNEVVDEHWADIRRWCPAIMKANQDYQLDPYLIAVLILQESGGHPEVISRSGAVGLMQVMPRDGIAAGFQCVAGPCFANRPSIEELKDPDFNVDYGSRLLAANVTRTGSVRDALFAYGPNNVGYTYADGILRIYEMIK